jgi:DNA-binding NtrC family response regulator
MAKSTILVVDREKILVDLLVRALASDDVVTFGTTSQEDAMRLLVLHAPTLVVMDPTIPNGFALIDAVIQSKAKTLVVSGSPEIAERARVAGVAEIVDRDAGLEELVAAIRRALNARFEVMGNAGGIRVLVTDDEDQVRNVLCDFLTTKGYNVRSATNGAEAVKIVNEDPSLQVVLLDVSMPEMGGLEALNYIMDRDNPPSTIMMTAVADREVARQALKMGAFDYNSKPFDFSVVDNSIAACLSHREFQKQPWWKRLARRQ